MSARSAALAALLSACSGAPEAPAPSADPAPAGPRSDRPDVLLVTLDTTRQDRIGAYGFGLARTPVIDRLAREGARFDDHATTAPITLPAHISILTGLTPPAHGVRDNGAYALSDEAQTLAEQLQGEGYDTAAFVSAVVLDRQYNLDQGFSAYDDDLWAEDAPATFFIRDRPARKTTDRVLAWLDAREGAADPDPFFAWVHYFDPHQPYEVDARAAGSLVTLPSPYDAEIAAVDTALGRIVAWLEARGRLDRTLIVVTADHGESLGDHGEKTHAVFIYDSTMKVPLVVRYAGAVPAGRVVEQGTSAVDVTPTVLGLVGAPAIPGVEGLDLSGPLRSGAPVPPHPAYIESLLSERGFGMAPLMGVRSEGVKYIRAPRAERYDLTADPRELVDLHAADPAGSAPYEALLDELLAASAGRALVSEANPMDAATQEMLLAMGYLAPESERRAMDGIDPKDGMPRLRQLEEARQAVRRRQFDAAEASLRALVEETPANVTAWNVLGFALRVQERSDEALEVYARSLSVDPRQQRVLAQIGALHLRAGRLDAARQALLQALEISPSFVEAMSTLASVEQLAGDAAKAEEWAQRAYAADPTFPRAWEGLAHLRFRQGKWAEARQWYERVLAETPTHFVVRVQAALSARRMGDLDGARGHLAEASRLRPDSWVPPYNQACLEAVAGRPEPALAALEQAAARGLAMPALLASDPDLEGLRGRPEWGAIQATVAANAARE